MIGDNSKNISSLSRINHICNIYNRSSFNEDITDMTVNRSDIPASLRYISEDIPHMDDSKGAKPLTMDLIPTPEEMKAYHRYKCSSTYVMTNFDSVVRCKIFSNN